MRAKCCWDSYVSDLTRLPSSSARCCAIMPPIELPTTWTLPHPSESTSCRASCAMSSVVHERVGTSVELPTPRLSKMTTWNNCRVIVEDGEDEHDEALWKAGVAHLWTFRKERCLSAPQPVSSHVAHDEDHLLRPVAIHLIVQRGIRVTCIMQLQLRHGGGESGVAGACVIRDLCCRCVVQVAVANWWLPSGCWCVDGGRTLLCCDAFCAVVAFENGIVSPNRW